MSNFTKILEDDVKHQALREAIFADIKNTTAEDLDAWLKLDAKLIAEEAAAADAQETILSNESNEPVILSKEELTEIVKNAVSEELKPLEKKLEKLQENNKLLLTLLTLSYLNQPFNDLSAEKKDAVNSIKRITVDSKQCGGQPCIRGMRIRVADILEMLAEGVSQAEILADFPDLESEDIRACLYFAAKWAANVGWADAGSPSIALIKQLQQNLPPKKMTRQEFFDFFDRYQAGLGDYKFDREEANAR